MEPNLPLFENRDWLNPQQTKPPLLWIQEVRILRRLELGQEAEIRRVPLHRGLNIVWAKPADPDEKDPAKRGSGHDVGKTTFCRLIRFLLGEEPCGSEAFRAGLAKDETLDRAWVVGEIVLDNKLWSVARALYPGAHHFAISGKSLDEAIVAPASERSSVEHFVKVIQDRIVSPLPVSKFDDAGTRPIRWLHILEWLARDQEAHLSALFKWRDTTSDHDSPELSAADAQFLVRCILGVTDKAERDQIEIRSQLNRDKATETENQRYHERRIQDALTRVRDELPDGNELPNVGEALFVDAVERHAERLVQIKRNELQNQLSQLNVDTAESALEQAIGNTAMAYSRVEELGQLVSELEEAVARYQEKKEPTASDLDDLDKVLSKLRPDRAFCEIPVSIALFQCPLLQEKRLSEAGSPHESSEALTTLAAEKLEESSRQLAGIKKNLDQANVHLAACRQKESSARNLRDSLREQIGTLQQQLAGLGAETAAWRVRAEDAQRSHTSLEATRTVLGGIEAKMETSKIAQDEAQKAVREQQKEIGYIFEAICHYFKGDNADAELRFTRDEINARIGSGGGAYRALSSISFDLAGLVARLHGLGHHPGILIHDSPRESDMEPSLYRPLFELVRHFERVAPDCFQYIITTTEPPPSDFLTSPHLCLSLDGSTPEGKLFRTTL